VPSSRIADRVVPLLYLSGAVLFWGTSFVATKTALDSFSPMAVIWLRMLVATLAFLPFLPFLARVPRPAYRRGDWRLLLIAGLCIPCLYYLFEGYAVHYTTSSQAGVISALVPLLVAAGAGLFLGERLSGRGAAAIVLSLGGVAVLSLSGTAQQSAPNPALGNVLELLAMTAAAGSMLSIKVLSERYNPWLLTGMQVVVGLVFFLPFGLLSQPGTWFSATPVAWACVAYLGVFVSLGAFGLYNSALTVMPANRASLAINLIPAVALLAGWAIRGEALTTLQLGACVLIVGVVAYAEAAGDPVEPPREVGIAQEQ
jgi:drug/metabolite transporter (DMT)-like permease